MWYSSCMPASSEQLQQQMYAQLQTGRDALYQEIVGAKQTLRDIDESLTKINLLDVDRSVFFVRVRDSNSNNVLANVSVVGLASAMQEAHTVAMDFAKLEQVVSPQLRYTVETRVGRQMVPVPEDLYQDLIVRFS